MLNLIGIHAFNHMDTLFFNLSDGSKLLQYSYSAMASSAPDDYRRALGADDRPLLILVDENDEDFRADQSPWSSSFIATARRWFCRRTPTTACLWILPAIAAAKDWMDAVK